jgi:hypothetical protein
MRLLVTGEARELLPVSVVTGVREIDDAVIPDAGGKGRVRMIWNAWPAALLDMAEHDAGYPWARRP